MIETALALLAAHVAADFLLQSKQMAEGKDRPAWLLAHGGIVWLTALAALGGPVEALLPVTGLALAHMAIDWIKTRLGDGLRPFLADQAAHLATIAAVAVLAPGLATLPLPALQGAVALAGLVLATRAGGIVVGKLMAGLAADPPTQGLANAGRIIGTLERGLIFLFVVVGQPAGIGFLIAAKSVLRFESASKDTSAAEYVIIGTLASFGWGVLAAYGTLGALGLLGFPGPLP